MTPKDRGRVVDASAGGGVGVLIVWILSLFDVPVTPAAASVLTAAIVAAVTALGRDGIKGIAHHIWVGFGNGDKKE